MKLLSLYVKSFGKLQNLKVDFKDGVNIFQQRNSFGKTTLATFVKAMLYGFKKNSKSSKYDANNATVWLSWNSTEKIGGSLTFEQDGNVYRVERYFGATAKDETLEVVNVKSGKLVNVENVGEHFLGLTEASYERSTYFPQESVEIASTDNFDARLANLVQNAENFDSVMAALKERKSKLSSTARNHAVIPDLEKEKLQLQRRLYDCENAHKRREEIDLRLREIEENRRFGKTKAAELEAQKSDLQKKLGTRQVTAQQQEAAARLVDLKEKLSRVGPDFEQDKKQCDDLAKQLDNTPEATKTQRPVLKPLLIAACILLAVGVGLCFVQLVVGLSIAAVALVCGVLSFFVCPKLTTLQAGEKDVLITAYFKIASKYIYCEKMDYTEAQKALWEKYNEYVSDKRVYNELSQLVSAPTLAESDTESKLEAVEGQLKGIYSSQESLSAEMGRLQEERKKLDVDSVSVREQLDEVQNKIKAATVQVAVTDKTMQLLQQAKENLSESYLPKLCARCQQLFAAVTGIACQLVIDRTFNIKLCANGMSKPLDAFSRGTREIALLCFRVALSELLFDGKIPFLIVDDAFVNFDEENFVRATKLLEKLSYNTQIIYFTCHNRLGALEKTH